MDAAAAGGDYGATVDDDVGVDLMVVRQRLQRCYATTPDRT